MKNEFKRTDKQAGGFARAAVLSPQQRSEIARNASLKRWDNVKKAATSAAPVEKDKTR